MSQPWCTYALFLCFLVVNCEVNLQNVDELKEEIDAVLNYLNASPFIIYKYKYDKLINAYKKAGIIELNLNVNVDCIRRYPDLPCTRTILNCIAYVQNGEGAPSRVLGEVKCKPNNEDSFIEDQVPTSSQNDFQPEIKQSKLALSNEAITNTFEEGGDQFVAIRRDSAPCLGCSHELKTNAQGVEELTDLALRHIESERNNKHALVKVLRLQQQIVSGVKFTLLVEVAPTTCTKDTAATSLASLCPIDDNSESTICEVTYLQKPWINKAKHIIKNNCTVSQEFVLSNEKSNDIGNDVNGGGASPSSYGKQPNIAHSKNSNFEHMAENGVIIEEITPVRLDDLESQIELRVIDEFVVPSTVNSEVNNAPLISTYEPITVDENQGSGYVFEVVPTVQEQGGIYQTIIVEEVPETTARNDEEVPTTTVANTDSSEEESKRERKSAENISESNSSSKQESSNESKSDSQSSEEKTRPKRAVRQLEKISQEEKPLVKNLADFAASALDNIDDDNHKRVVLQILGAKKMTSLDDDGTYYHLILRMGISRCLEDKIYEINCREKLLENYTKICKVQIHVNDEYGSPRVVKSQCQNIKRDKNESNRTNYSRFRRNVPGGQVEFDKNDPKIAEFLRDTVNHLDSKSEHPNKHKVVNVNKVTSQVVSGILYRIETSISLSDCAKSDSKDVETCGLLENSSSKPCTIKIWEQLWLKRREYTITCGEDEYKFEKTASRRRRSLKKQKAVYKLHMMKFYEFKEKFNKTYLSEQEHSYRFNVFRSNIDYIKVLAEYERGTAVYSHLTPFADMTREEFKKRLGYRSDLKKDDAPYPFAEIPSDPIPTEIDWREKGAVSEVKNQGQCGSCWAFSVTGNIEGQYAIKHGELLEFSEQELVDCDTQDQGCNGGLMDLAYRQIEELGGLETEQDYPYESEDEKCHFNRTLAKVQLSGAVNISQDESDMAQWLVKNGPISIAINANAMQFYVGGVSHPYKFLCNPNNLDHGVLIVGYGVHTYPKFKKTLPYWIVKNSWGTSWGEQGYYRVYKGDGTCGLNKTPSSAIVV